MSRPTVTVNVTNGNLGRTAPPDDGVSALIVSGVAIPSQIVLGDVYGPLRSLADAEALGIDAAYDIANTCMAHQHIKDFFDYAGDGVDLYIMVVAKTITMQDICDKTLTYAKKILSQLGGKVKMLGVTRIPDVTYTPTFATGFEQDLWDAVAKAKALVDEEFSLYRPVRIILEGRNFQGTASATLDLRDASAGPNANSVGIMIGADTAVSTARTEANKYAAVGAALGRFAAISVNTDIGRVKDGAMPVTSAGWSNNTGYTAQSETNVTTLHDHGYIFFLQHAGKNGFFFNRANAACPVTDDFAYLNLGRVIDKAARITRKVYLEELLDNIQVDPATGKLAPATIKHYQGIIKRQIDAEMTSKQEISRCDAFVDPNQNVQTTNEIKAEVNILPNGVASSISVDLAFTAE